MPLTPHAAVAPPRVRVASVPADHAYVRHLASRTIDDGVVRLPDPVVPGAPEGQWWPSPVLEPSWLQANADAFDLVHVHFGTEHLTPTQLTRTVEVLRTLHRPLVLTLHDLDHPHLSDQAAHLAALDVLVPAADALLTLTPGAATAVTDRWGRRPRVVPHPHVVPLERLRAGRPEHDGVVVGLQAKHRANNAPELVRGELAAAVGAVPGARLAPELDRRLTDDELWAHLEGLDVLVLAYRWATHSGFVEACADLGTVVVAPRTGWLAEQQDVVGYDLGAPGSLTAALRTALSRPRRPLDPARRAAQREEVAALHAEVYRDVVARHGDARPAGVPARRGRAA